MSETRPWERPSATIHSEIQTVLLDPLPSDLYAWVSRQAHDVGLTWLLAHCEDGVIWGKYEGGQLKLSSDRDAFPVRALALRGETLQQARLFGVRGELLIWRGPQDRWHCTMRRDDQGTEVEVIDEQHLLWGDRPIDSTPISNNFTRIVEGSQGITHAPPIDSMPTSDTTPSARARLKVRHYLGADPETGMVRITGSRLVRLIPPGEA